MARQKPEKPVALVVQEADHRAQCGWWKAFSEKAFTKCATCAYYVATLAAKARSRDLVDLHQGKPVQELSLTRGQDAGQKAKARAMVAASWVQGIYQAGRPFVEAMATVKPSIVGQQEGSTWPSHSGNSSSGTAPRRKQRASSARTARRLTAGLTGTSNLTRLPAARLKQSGSTHLPSNRVVFVALTESRPQQNSGKTKSKH